MMQTGVIPEGVKIFSNDLDIMNPHSSSKSYTYKKGDVYNKIMESVELKLREIDNGEFVVSYTKKIVELLDEPEMSLEVKAGQISEDVSRLVESLGYHVDVKNAIDDWVRLKAVKTEK